ncbi:MAG: sigma 54-interacting transcriptional regulator, partial [candidate division KSB1 bacterium]
MLENFRLSNLRLALSFSGILLLCCVLAVLPLAINETLEDALVDVQFKLRGERELSERFVLVFIGAEDIRALGGWPLTRDYYGYLMHILSARGAKVIGLDLLLDAPQWRYPEYDSLLAGYFEAFERDCLPMTFAEFAPAAQLFKGELPARPWQRFRQRVGGEGFSNFERATTLRRATLLAASNDTLAPSFGLELARLFLEGKKKLSFDSKRLVLAQSEARTLSFPLDAHAQLRLNHFGGAEQLTAISLVDLLQTFSAQPEALQFAGKLVLVAVTDPSLTTFKSTPLAASLPASFMHLTVAENLIQQNYLRELGMLGQLLSIAGAVFAVWFMSKSEKQKIFWVMGLGALAAYWAIAALFFRYGNLILPLFYPTLAAMSCLAAVFFHHQQEQYGQATTQRQLLQQAILAKETQLEAVEAARTELQQQLQNEEQEQALLSQTSRQQLEEQQRQILSLEKQLNDLRAYAAPAMVFAENKFSEIVSAPDSPMAEVLGLVAKVARDGIPVLIQGETGTGKELLARALHQSGKRSAAPFVAVNCGALPEALLESELFGHEKGSFTGAHARRRGRFELAAGGTIFLDEVGETTPAFQARLLRVLQEGTFERVGGEESLKANARVLAASNHDLQRAVAEKKFRADLFYRLNGVVL